MHVVTGIHTSLISACKIADDDYIMVLDKKEVSIHDGRTVKIVISKEAVLSGYKSKDGLWRVPLQQTQKITNENTDTIILDQPNPKNAIANVFELPSIKNAIAHYHAAA